MQTATDATATPQQTITVRVDGRNLFVDAMRLSKAERARLDTVPAGFLCSTGAMMYPATLIIGRRLRKIWPGVRFAGNGAERLVGWLDRFDLAHQYRDAGELPAVPVERSPAWDHQRRGFWFGYHLPAVLLSEKVGAGKTKQFLDIACNRDRRRVLVLTTASAVDDWPNHIVKHATKPYQVLAFGGDWRNKNATRKADALREFFDSSPYTLTAMSYDTSWRPPLGAIVGNIRGGSKRLGLLGDLPWDLIILDEIHNLADPAGRRSLFIWRLAERVPERIGGTGTIVRHKVEDMFAMFRALDPGLFGVRKEPFLERYCLFNRPSDAEIREAKKREAANAPALPGMENLGGADAGDLGPRYVVGYQRTDELARLAAAITFDPGDVDLHLPIPTHQTRRAYLSAKGQRVYDSLDEECAATLDDGTEIVAQNVLTQLLRLHQCACGFVGEPVIDPNTGEIDFVNIHEIDNAKEQLLEQTLRDLDPTDPVIIVGRFKQDIDVFRRVCRRVGRKAFEQSGRRKERTQWQNASGGEALCAQIQSACEAIDLTRSRYMILYSVGFSKYQIEQMYGRVDRPGQTRQPTYIHLLTHQTVDERIYRAIEKRQEIAATVRRELIAFRYSRQGTLNYGD